MGSKGIKRRPMENCKYLGVLVGRLTSWGGRWRNCWLTFVGFAHGAPEGKRVECVLGPWVLTNRVDDSVVRESSPGNFSVSNRFCRRRIASGRVNEINSYPLRFTPLRLVPRYNLNLRLLSCILLINDFQFEFSVRCLASSLTWPPIELSDSQTVHTHTHTGTRTQKIQDE